MRTLNLSKKLVIGLFVLLLVGLGILGIKFFARTNPCSRALGRDGNTTGPIGAFDRSIEYLKLIDVQTCVVLVENIEDSVFPDSSKRLKIGFFDKKGVLHVYPARLGGKDNTGRNIKPGFCFPSSDSPLECYSAEPQDIAASLEEGEYIEAELVYEDTAPWENANLVKKYQDTFNALKEAVQNGEGFPDVSDKRDFVIQIVQLTVKQ